MNSMEIEKIIQDLRNDSCYGCYTYNDNCKKLQNDAADLIEYFEWRIEILEEQISMMQELED